MSVLHLVFHSRQCNVNYSQMQNRRSVFSSSTLLQVCFIRSVILVFYTKPPECVSYNLPYIMGFS